MVRLVKEYKFQVDDKKKIGHMRCDFADGHLANQWFPTDLANETENLHEIQNVVNKIMFEEIPSYDKVVELCGGEGIDKTTNFFIYEGNYNYWINLIPIRGEYNYYIHVYKK